MEIARFGLCGQVAKCPWQWRLVMIGIFEKTCMWWTRQDQNGLYLALKIKASIGTLEFTLDYLTTNVLIFYWAALAALASLQDFGSRLVVCHNNTVKSFSKNNNNFLKGLNCNHFGSKSFKPFNSKSNQLGGSLDIRFTYEIQ